MLIPNKEFVPQTPSQHLLLGKPISNMPQRIWFSSSFSMQFILPLQGPAQIIPSRNSSWSFESGITIHFTHFTLSPKWCLHLYSASHSFFILVSGLNFKFIDSIVCLNHFSMPTSITDKSYEWRNKLWSGIRLHLFPFSIITETKSCQYFIRLPSPLSSQRYVGSSLCLPI